MTKKLVVAIVIMAALLLPATAHAAPLEDDKVVFGGSYDLDEGEVLDGDLLILGGHVDIDNGARVKGNVTLVGGSAIIDGRVDGDVSQVGGSLVLDTNSHVYGDVINNGGSLDREDGALVDGKVRTGVRTIEVHRDRPGNFGSFILDGLLNLFVVFSSSALTVVIALLWQKRLEVVGQAITTNPIMAGGTGLLVVGVSLPILIVIMFTLVLIPVSLIGFVLLAAAGAFGWAALSHEIGIRISGLANQEWSPALAAGLGSILIGIIYVGVAQIPCIGWAMQAMVGLIGLGAVTMTRFGEHMQEGLG